MTDLRDSPEYEEPETVMVSQASCIITQQRMGIRPLSPLHRFPASRITMKHIAAEKLVATAFPDEEEE